MNYVVGMTVYYCGMLRGEMDTGRVLWADGKEVLVEGHSPFASRHLLRTDHHVIATTEIAFYRKLLENNQKLVKKAADELDSLEQYSVALTEKLNSLLEK